jgi:hypothetical protein
MRRGLHLWVQSIMFEFDCSRPTECDFPNKIITLVCIQFHFFVPGSEEAYKIFSV